MVQGQRGRLTQRWVRYPLIIEENDWSDKRVHLEKVRKYGWLYAFCENCNAYVEYFPFKKPQSRALQKHAETGKHRENKDNDTENEDDDTENEDDNTENEDEDAENEDEDTENEDDDTENEDGNTEMRTDENVVEFPNNSTSHGGSTLVYFRRRRRTIKRDVQPCGTIGLLLVHRVYAAIDGKPYIAGCYYCAQCSTSRDATTVHNAVHRGYATTKTLQYIAYATTTHNSAQRVYAATTHNAAQRVYATTTHNAAQRVYAATMHNAAQRVYATTTHNAAQRVYAATTHNAAQRVYATTTHNAAQRVYATTTHTTAQHEYATTTHSNAPVYSCLQAAPECL
eukprot:2245683-Rhodomonas_salina.1